MKPIVGALDPARRRPVVCGVVIGVCDGGGHFGSSFVVVLTMTTMNNRGWLTVGTMLERETTELESRIGRANAVPSPLRRARRDPVDQTLGLRDVCVVQSSARQLLPPVEPAAPGSGVPCVSGWRRLRPRHALRRDRGASLHPVTAQAATLVRSRRSTCLRRSRVSNVVPSSAQQVGRKVAS